MRERGRERVVYDDRQAARMMRDGVCGVVMRGDSIIEAQRYGAMRDIMIMPRALLAFERDAARGQDVYARRAEVTQILRYTFSGDASATPRAVILTAYCRARASH